MNEFIIWDKDLKIFEEIKTDSDKSFFGTYLIQKNRFNIFRNIGLKDINGKKIYANSSIVEFEWGQDKHNIIGYFTFNKEFLQYEIIMLNVQKNKSLAYSPYTCINFKVIDTTQENTLGLIK